MKWELVEDMPVLDVAQLHYVGEMFGIRLVDGCSNGCAELYAEDDGNWHFKMRFDRQWLKDLAQAAHPSAPSSTAPSQPEVVCPYEGGCITPNQCKKTGCVLDNPVPPSQPAEGPTPESDALLEAAERVSHLPSEVGDKMRDLERQRDEARRELAAEKEKLARALDAYASACVRVVKMGVKSFGTLDEGLDKLAAQSASGRIYFCEVCRATCIERDGSVERGAKP